MTGNFLPSELTTPRTGFWDTTLAMMYLPFNMMWGEIASRGLWRCQRPTSSASPNSWFWRGIVYCELISERGKRLSLDGTFIAASCRLAKSNDGGGMLCRSNNRTEVRTAVVRTWTPLITITSSSDQNACARSPSATMMPRLDSSLGALATKRASANAMPEEH